VNLLGTRGVRISAYNGWSSGVVELEYDAEGFRPTDGAGRTDRVVDGFSPRATLSIDPKPDDTDCQGPTQTGDKTPQTTLSGLAILFPLY
jgi:hypothetical protein